MKILKRMKWYYVLPFLMAFIMALLPYLFIRITLNGDSKIELEYGTTYEEEGANGFFLNTPLTVKITGTIDPNQLGDQILYYQVKNQLGIIRKKKRIVTVVDKAAPVITFSGGDTITLRIGDTFHEPGYQIVDNYDGDITSKVKVTSSIDLNQTGTYEITYEGSDSSGNKVEKKRKIIVEDKEFTYQSSYNDIDNKINAWWTGNKKNGIRPETGAGATQEDLKKYDAYYIGNDEKVIYLTFDEGTPQTYLKEIVDVLNKNDVKATFFLCNNYIKSDPELMKNLVEHGHSVGNHTHNHETMANYANEENFDTYLQEIKDVEDTFLEITGHPLDKVYREPRGEWSYRSLQIMKDLGYRSYFWSAAYNDFSGDLSKEEALSKLLAQKHNGAIYLIHPTNKGNYEAMDDFIKTLKEEGYTFGLVKDIS